MAKPNILFLMSDEHRADTAGFAGNTVVRTPTLDWLARTGVVFNNAYTPSPICIPGRQSLMSGQLPRTCGCEHFGQDLPPFSMTWSRRLSQHGYATVCCGKLHHVGPDQMQGWLSRPFGDLSVDRRHLRDADASVPPDAPLKQYKWSDAKELLRAGVGRGPYQTFDELSVAAAVRAINGHFLDPFYDRPTPDRPMLLKVSLLQPHFPYLTDEERFNYYLNRVRPFEDQPVFDHPFLSQRQVAAGRDGVNARDRRRATAAYYGMIEAVDTHFGVVLDALRAAGQDLEDWVIVYTSDHGEMLGEHGVWEKQKFFEASARVPLIVRWPRGFGPRVVEQNVSLCDLFATLCDLADVPLPPVAQTVHGRGLDSRSLVPLLHGNAAGWDDEAVSQFGGGNLMVKRGSLKYQFYDRPDCRGSDCAEVLFDLEADPQERRNAVADPQWRDALAAFRDRRDALGFGPPSA